MTKIITDLTAARADDERLERAQKVAEKLGRRARATMLEADRAVNHVPKLGKENDLVRVKDLMGLLKATFEEYDREKNLEIAEFFDWRLSLIGRVVAARIRWTKRAGRLTKWFMSLHPRCEFAVRFGAYVFGQAPDPRKVAA